MVKDWEVLSRKLAEDYRIFQVWEKQARSPRTGGILDVKSVHINPWAMVLAVTPADEIVMVRQFRHGIEQVCLELPGGLLDPEDPSPAEAARRELLEETGLTVTDVVDMGECFPLPALLNNKGHFFLGSGAAKVSDPALDEGEDIEVVLVPFAEIPRMIAGKEINHGMVLLAFFFYWQQKIISATGTGS